MKEEIIKSCVMCGQSFDVNQRLGRFEAITCSKVCARRYHNIYRLIYSQVKHKLTYRKKK